MPLKRKARDDGKGDGKEKAASLEDHAAMTVGAFVEFVCFLELLHGPGANDGAHARLAGR